MMPLRPGPRPMGLSDRGWAEPRSNGGRTGVERRSNGGRTGCLREPDVTGVGKGETSDRRQPNASIGGGVSCGDVFGVSARFPFFGLFVYFVHKDIENTHDWRNGLLDEVARGEVIEKELDAMIERRARKGDVDPDELEEMWRESVRRDREKQRERNRWEWIRFFERMAESHAAMSQDYARRAAALLEGP